MQHILPAEFIFGPGYFEHIKKDERPKRQRELQRQPAPLRKISFQPDVNTKYLSQAQDSGA